MNAAKRARRREEFLQACVNMVNQSLYARDGRPHPSIKILPTVARQAGIELGEVLTIDTQCGKIEISILGAEA